MAMPCPGTPFTAHAMGPGGGDRIRTDDPLVANQVLYQLSYAPVGLEGAAEGGGLGWI